MNPSSRVALKPCPVCGGKADWMERDGATGTQYFVECQPNESLYGCVRQSVTYATKREAIADWNVRAPHTVRLDVELHALALENNTRFSPIDMETFRGIQGYAARLENAKSILSSIQQQMKQQGIEVSYE